VPSPANCLSFDRARGRAGKASGRQSASGAKSRSEQLTDIFDQLSPAQCAFLSGVLAILAEHGEDALIRSCEMVMERFRRGHAG
jgi:hypothetical protein